MWRLLPETPMFFRFLLVGGSFSLSYAVMTAVLISFGAPPFWTAFLLYSIAIPLAYLAQKQFTFRAMAAQKHAFWVYLSTQLLSFALVAGVTTRFVMHHVWADTALYLVTAGAAAVLSFGINRTFAFNAKG